MGQAVNRVLSMLKLLVRGVSMRPWASLATLIACWFALCQLMLVFHAAAFASRAKTLSGASGTVIAYLSGRPDTGAVRALGERIAAMEEIAGVEFIPCSTGLERLRQWLGPDDSLVRDLDPKVLPTPSRSDSSPGMQAPWKGSPSGSEACPVSRMSAMTGASWAWWPMPTIRSSPWASWCSWWSS